MVYKRNFAISFLTIILGLTLFLFVGCNKEKKPTDISKIDFNLPELSVIYNGQAQEFGIDLGQFSSTYKIGEDYVLEYFNNTNVGEGYVIIKAIEGSQKLVGEKKVKFNILPLDLKDTNITVVCDDVVFNGNENTLPNITLKYFDNIIPASDYDAITNENSGVVGAENSLTIFAKEQGNLKNSVTASYNVLYCPLSDCTINFEEAVFNGTPKQPQVTIKIGENIVPDDVVGTLTFEYSGNTNAGKGQLTITANTQNSYFEVGDSVTAEFDILPADLAEFGIGAQDIAEVLYDEQSHKIVPTLTGNINYLTENDYVIKYYRDDAEITEEADFVDGGMITIKIIGQNNFCGELNASYFIKGTDISSDENLVVNYAPTFEYTGQAIEPEVSVSYNGEIITDYVVSYENNTAVGTGKIKITFSKNYSGEVTKTFSITPISINNLSLTLLQDSVTWKPQGAVVDVSLANNDVELILGQDYDLLYNNNDIVGTATVKATGKGNYTGETQEVSYTITKLDITECSLKDFETEIMYSGAGQQQTVMLTYSQELASGTDIAYSNFDVTYYKDENLTEEMLTSEMVDAGTVVYIKIEGKNNLSGSFVSSYEIIPFELTSQNTTITLDEGEFTFNGDEHEPEIIDVEVNGFNNFDANCYEISYSSNINAGWASVIIAGKGNFNGTATQTFKINPTNLLENYITWAETAVYDGETHSIIPSVSGTLITENDYDVYCYDEFESDSTLISGTSLLNITKSGNYFVKVVGKNNFVGIFVHTTKILPQENEFLTELQIRNWIYGDEPETPTIEAKYGTPVFWYKPQNGGVWSIEVPTQVGKYYVKAVVEKATNYSGIVSESVLFEILQNSELDVEITIEDVVYTGEIQNAKITFLNGSFAENEDYTLTYYKTYPIEEAEEATQEERTNAGKLYVLITPIGEAFEEQVLEFNILKAQNKWLSDFEVYGCEFGESVVKPEISSKFGEPVVYFKSYEDGAWGEWQVWTNENKPVDAQKYMAKAVTFGTDNYYELETNYVLFKITPQVLSTQNISYTYNGGAYTQNSAVYNGQTQALDFVITDKNAQSISLDNFIIQRFKNERLVTQNNVKNAGTYVYNISGRKNYIFGDGNETIQIEFKINPQEVVSSDLTLDLTESYSLAESNGAVQPEVVMSFDENALAVIKAITNDDYVVSYENNTAVGTGKIKLTFSGNYSGVLEFLFTIVE